jgi:adenosylhomocysteine nucleosidase
MLSLSYVLLAESPTVAAPPVTGILGAFDEEVAFLQSQVDSGRTVMVLGIPFIVGSLGGAEVVLAETGVGKVNAAMTTTLLIDHFAPAAVLFTGIAGSLSDSLMPGDIVVGERTAQHDLVVVTDEGRERFGVGNPVNGKRNPVFISGDSTLIALADRAAGLVSLDTLTTSIGTRAPRVVRGTIVTGDAFVASSTEKRALREDLGADAVEMEGAAVAQVCYQHGVPCLVIRSISDHADAGASDDLERFYQMAARNSAALVREIVRRR